MRQCLGIVTSLAVAGAGSDLLSHVIELGAGRHVAGPANDNHLRGLARFHETDGLPFRHQGIKRRGA